MKTSTKNKNKRIQIKFWAELLLESVNLSTLF